MCQRIRWNVLVVLVVFGQAFGQVMTQEDVIFVDSAGSSPGQPAKPGAIHFAGKVVDPNGRPMAGAKVTLTIMRRSEMDASSKIQSQEQSMTDRDGMVSFLAEKRETNDPRWSVIVVDRPGSAWGWASWGLSRDVNGVEIRLTAPKSLAGTVVDEAGRPIPEAQVTLAAGLVPGGDHGISLGGEASERMFTASTDGSGRFRFERLPADASVDLLVRKPGRATINTNEGRTVWTGTLQYAAGREDIQIQMPVEARIDGVVVEKATGRPVPGIRVEVARRSEGRVSAGRPIPSGEDGTFAFQGLVPGTYFVRSVQQAVQDWAPCDQQITVESGKTAQVRLELVKGGILEVIVKEDQGRRPAEKAHVQVRDEAHDAWHSGATDPNGVARIRLTPGEYQINTLYKEGHARINPNEQVSIEEGKTIRYEYTFAQQPKVQGIVLDPNGRPATGIRLQVYPVRGQEASSDAQGRFEASWDPANMEESQFCLVARDVQRNLAVAREVDTETGQVEIKLETGLVLTGRVVDPNHEPLAKAGVYVMLRFSNWGATIGGQIRAGSDGRFSMAALPQGYGYEVMANADGFGQVRKTISQDEAVAGPKDVGDLQLALANLSITGIVVDANDAPLADVQMNTYGEGQPDRFDIRTDAQGRFTINGVCEGPIQISANTSRPQQMYGSVRTEGGATDVKIVVRDRSSSGRSMPRPIPALVGKPLPDLKGLGLTLADANDKPLLVCFFDIEQRPSRRCLSDLAKKAETLAAKGVSVAVIQTSKVDLKQYEDWLKTNQIALPIHVLEDAFEAKKAAWGVKALPWLILTDRRHVVKAEGFGIGELEKALDQ